MSLFRPLPFPLALIALFSGAVAAAPVPTPAVAHPSTAPELRARIEEQLRLPRFDRALWGIKILSLDTGRTLFEHNADRLVSPASNAKLYTGALALDHFGEDYRIVTPIEATAAPDGAGTVKGDLIVRGRGDPSWKSGPERADFAAVFEPFVAVLAKAGVRRIAGEIVADATYFRGPPQGAEWAVDDLNEYYGAEISAVSLEDNYAQLRIAPGAAVGQPGELAWLQPHTGLALDNRTSTVAAGGKPRVEVRRLVGESVLHVWGELPLAAKPELFRAPVPQPAAWFAEALKAALAQRGIAVEGRARGVRWPDAPPAAAGTVKLGEIASPPLRELVAAFMKPSQNLETELIFAHVGESLRPADAPPWRTSAEVALEGLRDFFQRHGLPASDVRLEDGSGLSSRNLTTANATAALLRFMATHRAAAAFADTLPIAGVDGSLSRRLRGTPAEGNLRAKTGTMRYTKSLSGYVTTAAGERLVFSLILNRDAVPPGRNGTEEIDAIAALLAGFRGRVD